MWPGSTEEVFPFSELPGSRLHELCIGLGALLLSNVSRGFSPVPVFVFFCCPGLRPKGLFWGA